MRQVLAHAAMVTSFAVAASLAICWAALTALGRTMDVFSVAMCVICPVAVAFPVSAYNHSQKRKIATAHRALEAAHRELAAMHGKLAEKARRDEMTGLLNRSAFIALVEEMRAQDGGGSLLLVDADNFKRINDSFGHLAGDEALRLIARAIRGAVRRTDPKGRLGGEEFGIYVGGAGMDEASGVAERVRKAVESLQFRPLAQETVRLTVSIGVAASQPGAGFSELMGEADKRLYEAKRLGRNRVILPDEAAAA